MKPLEIFYHTKQIEYHSRLGDTHWFDKDTKRFFNSRIGERVYRTNNPFLWLFVSSERCDWADGTFAPMRRKYSVRVYDTRSCSVDTIGEFQAYQTRNSAHRAAKKMALEMVYTMEDQHEEALTIDSMLTISKKKFEQTGNDTMTNLKHRFGI